jgi:SWI/SNF-related matrix-associated actin-dependent regulator of chromatin subfamily A member 5
MDKAKVSCPLLLLTWPSIHQRPQITDSVKRYSYLLGQTDLFRHFVDIKVCSLLNLNVSLIVSFLLITFQRARDPEYAALMDTQPKPKGRGRKKVA